ncbi:MAG: polysaccharide lyase [Cyanobacteria bacterium P01_F01_bin.86]
MVSETFSPVFDGAVLTGDADKNNFTGTNLNDHLSGLTDKDQLRGLDGMDLLEGGAGKDQLFGGDGEDRLDGGEDKDKLFGGNDNDWLFGGDGKDLLQGDEGDDTLVGGEGRDTLRGGAGNDLIDSGEGRDSVYLGAGSDVLVLSAGNGYDKINDFQVGTDKIQLRNLTFDDLEMVAKGRNDTIIQINRPGHLYDGERLARFKGVSIDQLGVDDFTFASPGSTKQDDPSTIADEPKLADQDPLPDSDDLTPTKPGPTQQDDPSAIADEPKLDDKTPLPDSSEPMSPQEPIDPGTRSDDSPPFDDGATNETPVDDTPLWSNSFANSDWMDDWDVRNGKSWGFDNLDVIPDSRGESGEILRVDYPAGSASPSVSRAEGVDLGGAQFYADLDLPPQDELRLSYDVRFAEDFDFVKGGKLPGLFGGEGASGGNIPDGTDGFSTRLMWRQDGDGEVYAYLPTSEGYGTSIERGAWQFEPGDWYRIEQEVKLNHPDRSDGEIRVWVNDELVIEQRNLQFRTVDSLKIDGIFFSTFFGGGDSSWSTPEDTHIDFANFEVTAPA